MVITASFSERRMESLSEIGKSSKFVWLRATADASLTSLSPVLEHRHFPAEMLKKSHCKCLFAKGYVGFLGARNWGGG